MGMGILICPSQVRGMGSTQGRPPVIGVGLVLLGFIAYVTALVAVLASASRKFNQTSSIRRLSIRYYGGR
jgi:hypothetical protein